LQSTLHETRHAWLVLRYQDSHGHILGAFREFLVTLRLAGMRVVCAK
jgi:hypothetical protein